MYIYMNTYESDHRLSMTLNDMFKVRERLHPEPQTLDPTPWTLYP